VELFSRFGGRASSGSGPAGVPSKEIARERLRMALINDRASVSPQFIQMLRQDVILAVSKYMDIDESATNVNLSSSDASISLVASIPIRRMKRAGEITGRK